jgi:hypothetical protein
MTNEEKQISWRTLENFRSGFSKFIVTSRFNNSTWSENEKFRKKHSALKCIYCAPEEVSKTIPSDAIMFVMEMNNDTNKIIGIGMVRNHSYSGVYNVYDDGNYNRYTYIGKMRISRSEMTEHEEKMMTVLDKLLFTGIRHMKRGQGLRCFPIKTLYECKEKKLDLVDYISKMFKARLDP